MIVFACTPYFKELIHSSDKRSTTLLFQTACQVLAPQLDKVDGAEFCKALGVTDDYIPLFYSYTKSRQHPHEREARRSVSQH